MSVTGSTPVRPVDAGGLVERARHLAQLDDAVVTRGGPGSVFLVAGEAGAGKTALVHAFCATRPPSERVFWGACDSLFTPRPFGPFLDIAQAMGGEIEEMLAGGPKPHDLATALMRELAGYGSSILVIEDLHWADEATLDVFRVLARRIDQIPVLLVATYRDEDVDRAHPLRLVLGDLGRDGSMRRMIVEPFSLDAVQRLAASSGIDPRQLFAATDGNPFFVTEVLASPNDAIPGSVRDAVLARAARLDDAARRVLDAVAVAPPFAQPWLVEALVGEDASRLDDCLNAGMLRPVQGGVAFRHELARRAIEDSIPPHRMVALHRAAQTALAAPPSGSPDLTRLAHHAEQSGDGEAVLRYAPEAASRAASVGAHREAAAQYRRALRFASEDGKALRADLLERLSQECYLTDQGDEAISALNDAIELRRSLGDRRAEAIALCALSRRYWCRGYKKESEEAGRMGIDLLAALPPSRELAFAYGNLGQLAMNDERAEEAIEWAERAIALATELDEPEVILHSLNNIGTMEFLAGGSTDKLERSIALAEEAGLDEHVGRALIHVSWGIARNRAYHLAHWFDEGVDACAKRGLELWRFYVVAHRARYHLDTGRWTEAVESVAPILRYERSSFLLSELAYLITGTVRARRGDPERWDALDSARDLCRSDELQWVGPIAIARAEAAWLDGLGADVVAAETNEAFDLALRRNAGWVSGELAVWRRRAGIDEEVTAEVAKPYRLELDGQHEAAAELWAEIGCPYDSALALADPEDDDLLRRSLAELQQLGARPAAAIVARRLRERGVKGVPRGPRKSTEESPANLTARETEVLTWVARGEQNGEIARRLHLSDKTVEHHVSAILRKLGVKTRGQASAEAVRLDLV